MAKIKVHVLGFGNTHIKIVLENTSTAPHVYYHIDRWEPPYDKWSIDGPKRFLTSKKLYSTLILDIDLDPEVITTEWKEYWHSTRKEASAYGKNCASSVQWFLTKYAGIPNPSLSNISLDCLIMVFWPSFIPCPIMIPDRIMSNAKFYHEARMYPEKANQYSSLFLYMSMALTALMFTASILALVVATTILSGGVAALVIIGSASIGTACSYGFFKAYNTLSAKNIAYESKKTVNQSSERKVASTDPEYLNNVAG